MVPKRQWVETTPPSVGPGADPVPAARSSEAAAESPARALQRLLAEAYASSELPEPYVERLPPAARLGVLAGLVVGSWSIVLAAVWLVTAR